MSGSSLDGLDLAWCRFERNHPEEAFQWELLDTGCIPFPSDLQNKLSRCRTFSALELAETERNFVAFSAACIQEMCLKSGRKPLAIASHGHTVFHNPDVGYSVQIGNGGLLYGLIEMPVVSDFRTVDVALGGQGAPLVPGAEAELFSEFTACLNLGGICNISFPGKNNRGFDVGPCNQLLNYISRKQGKDYDENGTWAAGGKLIPELLQALHSIEYYKRPAPKSLSNEDVANFWIPELNLWEDRPEDVLHTLCLHISGCIAAASPEEGKMLVSGGGAFNGFLTDSIRKACGENLQLIMADPQLAASKEALCFAWLGLKRLLGEVNVRAAVTGASRDSVCGAVYGPATLFPNQRH